MNILVGPKGMSVMLPSRIKGSDQGSLREMERLGGRYSRPVVGLSQSGASAYLVNSSRSRFMTNAFYSIGISGWGGWMVADF